MNRIALMIISIVMSGPLVRADISDAFRNENAVVLYDFSETSGDVIDKANPKYGAPLNLQIYKPNFVVRAPGSLKIDAPNVVASRSPASKIATQCKASGGLTYEIWLEGNSISQDLSGLDADDNPQPLRILSLSSGLKKNNFLFGQFYDGGDLYIGGVSTSGNAQAATLQDPLLSSQSSTLVTNPAVNPSGNTFQKIVVTLGPSGLARLYLSDNDRYMYLAQQSATGFGTSANPATYFSKWDANAFLTLGNEYMTPAAYDSWSKLNTVNYPNCDNALEKTTYCFSNPNRYWKGTLHKVAVYCSELSKETILGAGVVQNVKKNALLDIDINTQITPGRLKAQEIYQRLTGLKTPISNPLLGEMESLLNSNDPVAAAAKATADPSFLNITVRDFASRMSNREEIITVPLNDFTATIIGFVRDNISAQKLLTENIVYQADRSKAPIAGNLVNDMLLSNNHYETLTTGRYDLKEVLVARTQKIFNGKNAVDNPSPAGLLTTRQWMAAHAIAGTSRRLVEFAFREFTCHSMDTIADSLGPDNVIGPDIDRFPGGSHSKFTTSCRACHTVLDGFRPAFARWTFSNNFAKNAFVVPVITDPNADEDTSMGMFQNPAYVAKKNNQNTAVFAEGRVTADDNWVNNANRGTNADIFKWTKLSGKGLKEFGQALVETPAFSQCMAQRVFKQVCKREPASVDKSMLEQAAKEFSSVRSYNLKFLFEKIVTSKECLGGN